MSRRAILLLLFAVFLSIGGCGGSSHSTASAPPSTSPPTSAAASTSTPTSTTQSSTTTTPASGGAGVSGGKKKKKKNDSGGSTNVRVPATFAIHAGGALVPATVSAPAFLAVRVTVSSADGLGYQVVVRTPTPYTLAVPAGGKASVLIPGQRAGQYKIDVDGRTRGALLIGGEPGP